MIVHYWVTICWSFRCTPDSSVKPETVHQPVSCQTTCPARSKQMFRIVWVVATNDMDGLQAVGDRLCDICDFGRIHLITAIFSHEQSYSLTSLWTPDSIPCVHKLAPNDSQSSNPFLHTKYSFQHFNLLIASHYSVTWQTLSTNRVPILPGFLLPNGPFYFSYLTLVHSYSRIGPMMSSMSCPNTIRVTNISSSTASWCLVVYGFVWRWNLIVQYWRSW